MEKNIEIKEKPVLKNELNCEIISTGEINENINEVKEYALQMKEYYSNLIFSDEQKDIATKERTSLNKMVKRVADYRKNIVSEFKKPIEKFELIAKETEKILQETSDFVGNQIKKFEETEKEERNKLAKKIYEENIEELKDIIPYEKIFNDKWLNKGSWNGDNSKVVLEDIERIKEIVRNGLKAIEELNSEFETEIKNGFLKDFNLSAAILKNSELIAQKEKLKKVENKKTEQKEKKIEELINNPIKEEMIDPIKTYTLKITGALSKQKKLKEFLELNDMKWERVNINE